ncbi:MAG: flippase-like domain-containing protein [Candidatus Hydrothermarchaeaceae archaeon]
MIVLLLLMLIVIMKVDWGDVVDILSKGNMTLILSAFIVAGSGFFAWALKWKNIINKLVEVNYSRVFVILMSGIFINTVTPGANVGGEAIRAYYLSKATGLKKRGALATIMLDKSCNYTAISTFLIFSIFVLLLFLRIPIHAKLVLEVASVAVVLIALSAFHVKRRHKALESMPGRVLHRIYYFKPLKALRSKFERYILFETYVMEMLGGFISTFRALLGDRRVLGIGLLLGFFVWFAEFVKTYLIFHALGSDVSIMLVIAVETISMLIGIFVFLPGGIGATELSMITLFSSCGIDMGTATAVTLVSRSIYFIFALGIGYASTLWLKLRG